MSFKIKDKTVYLSLMSLVTVIFAVVYVILALNDNTGSYTETTKNIVLVIVGAFFNNGTNFSTQNNNVSRGTTE
jgi:hypothetical protein